MRVRPLVWVLLLVGITVWLAAAGLTVATTVAATPAAVVAVAAPPSELAAPPLAVSAGSAIPVAAVAVPAPAPGVSPAAAPTAAAAPPNAAAAPQTKTSVPRLATPAPKAPAPRVAVLTYHDVFQPARGPYSVTPDRLEADLRWFLTHGWQPLTLAEFQAWMAGERSLSRDAFLLTFDDGYASVLSHALPVLQRLRVPATVFVITGVPPAVLGESAARMTPEQLQELARSGLVALESHTHDLHRSVKKGGTDVPAVLALSPAEVAADLAESARTLAEITGRAPVALAWPYGQASTAVKQLAVQQFPLLFTGDEGLVRRGQPHQIQRFAMEWRQQVHLEQQFGRR